MTKSESPTSNKTTKPLIKKEKDKTFESESDNDIATLAAKFTRDRIKKSGRDSIRKGSREITSSSSTILIEHSLSKESKAGEKIKKGIKNEDNDSFKIKIKDSEIENALESSDVDDNADANTTLTDRPLSSLKRSRGKINYNEFSSDDDDDDKPLSTSGKINKRRRQTFFHESDDDESDEYIPDKKQPEDDIEDDDDLDDFIADDDEDDDDIIALSASSKRKTLHQTNSIKDETSSRSSSSSSALKKFDNKFNNSSNNIHSSSNKTEHVNKIKPSLLQRPKSGSGTIKNKNFNKQNEERYQWLVDERDAQGRPPTDPEYDSRTLYIPPSAWNKFTPFEKQYWEIKSKMWDCIVFFKKGKFFELYEKDAFLANALFDWKLAGNGRANMQLAGIPEMSFELWASKFIELGYKVAKVDQRESMLAKEMREGSKGIVKRELECVLTSGTLTDGDMIHNDLSTYCLAIREEPGNYYDLRSGSEVSNKKIFGIAFIDTATGEIQMIEIEDDNECSNLDTIMSQIKPKEVILERNNLSNLANKIVKFNASNNAIYNFFKPEKEFYTFEKTYDVLTSGELGYFEKENEWPPILQKYYKEERKIGFSAFGALLHYLKWLKLDEKLVSMGNIIEYNPIQSQNSLILDGITLQNLEIFSNTYDGSEKGTLFRLFNNSVTSMGKRMMRRWLMHPLLIKGDIEKRLDTVELLMSNIDLRQQLEKTLAKLPDLERMLSRVHSCSIKVKDFERVIQGFEDIIALFCSIKKNELKGAIASFIEQIPSTLVEDVEKWSNSFDRIKASVENIIVPQKGVDPDFDKSIGEINSLETELNEILVQYRKDFKCSNINFKDSGKELYLIELPVNISKRVPANWTQMAANKSIKRYYSDEVKTLARCMAEARESHKILEENLKNRLCKKFDTLFHSTWMPTIHIISNIDCLVALARTSESLGFPSCRPQFVDEIDPNTGNKLNGFVKFKSLRHPCFNEGSSIIREFIPNDIELGKDVPQFGLLTGANAAGKSTILRMTCIAVIMAQMGCYVPCETAQLTPVDRIMTRLGANDNIMQGKSTFFVELAETKKILDNATNRSLLVIDELGRGGSSSDGFAIAESVLYHIATHIQSIGYFATHYGTLGAQFIGHLQVRPMRMSILVDEETRNVTFLYKLEDGASEGSFGMHVASMCDIPKVIVDEAEIAAENLEHTSKLMKQKQLSSNELKEEDLINLLDGLQSDFVRLVFGAGLNNQKDGSGEGVKIYDANIKGNLLKNLYSMIENINN